jgi:putative hydrolase of the HAD superfamily
VLLDAFGTLISLDAPAPLLRALLGRRLGLVLSERQAAAAVAAEVAYYRTHMQQGADARSLAALHDRCAAVLRAALPPSAGLAAATPETMRGILLEMLRFRVFPEVPAVLARLRDAGLRLVVASNWDVSLSEVLDRLGLAELVDGVVSSAAVGAAKPDPRLLEAALGLAGVAPTQAVHVGDSLEEDVGAAQAAGVAAVLLVREPAARAVGRREATAVEVPAGVPVISSLQELPALIGVSETE